MSMQFPIKIQRRVLSFLPAILIVILPISAPAEPDWYTTESEHFRIIYRRSHAHLTPHILRSAENALASLMYLFNYRPSEKIVINTYDFSDYGSAGATTVPHNFIRLEIEPLEPGYENIPYNERIQWLLSHELVHVVVNDLSSGAESFLRTLFSKVPPEKEQPLSIYYSLLTNFSRYTPRWHQEGIAVFMETWLNGGFGRLLGNFDEMYFRSLVVEGESFPTTSELLSQKVHNSFLLEILSYLYGARFVAFLSASFGADKVLAWFGSQSMQPYTGYESRFRNSFGLDLDTAWKYFIHVEKKFQKQNLAILQSAPFTPLRKILNEPVGWVTQPFIDKSGAKVIFGCHRPHHLTSIYLFDFDNNSIKEIGSLPTPSIIQVASTAYDNQLGVLFYTTNNNQLYRDVWALNLKSMRKKLLFENARVGELTVSSKTHELWGIRHSSGRALLVYSANPYRELEDIIEFQGWNELQHLAVSPSGKFLAATLHQTSGEQAIIVANLELLKKQGRFTYETISTEGSPEFPSWGPDEDYLFWNAYVNGVSNIYRYHKKSSQTVAMSHTRRGLFRPLCLNEKYLFAYEFTSEGFLPVLVPNRPAERLPAIHYYGQKVVEKNPQVINWALQETNNANHDMSNGSARRKPYSGLAQVQFHSFFPVLSGFRDQKIVGLYTHLADPLFVHDLILEVGWSPFDRNQGEPDFHFKGKYEYKRTYRFEVEHNAPNFYDLLNERKASLMGTKVALGHTRYWKYDNPHKIKQTTDLTFYRGVEAINDNLIVVSNPDFLIFETATNSRNIRRAIGSVDNENGYDWTVTLMGLGVDFQNPSPAGGFYAEWNQYHTWGWPHNVLHLQLGAGYLRADKNLAIGKFYLGGFGNQYLEKGEVKQFRQLFRFPGVAIYSLSATTFGKVMLEHNLPPLRFGNLRVGSHLLDYIDFSWFSQGLMIHPDDRFVNLGGQINFVFKHWFNLESTFSFGAAQAWSDSGSSRDWFVSFKLLK